LYLTLQKWLYIFVFLLQSIFLWNHSLLASQQEWHIKNFSKKEYQAANQNWSVDASPNGFMYFANHAGLLEFDGTSWALYRLPNQTILRSVRVFNDSTLFTGGYREIGFWKADRNGKLNYNSLNLLAAELLGNNDEFWNICFLNDAVYFHSFTKILKYKNNKITSVELPGFVTSMNCVDDEILIGVRDKGVHTITGDKTEPYITDPQLENAIIRFIIPYSNAQILIGTSSDGIYLWDGQQLKIWNEQWNDYFRRNEVNRAHINKNGHLIIGTIIDGIIAFDENRQQISSYNTSNGFQNNTILDIATDIYGNDWFALDSGIDFISYETGSGIEYETIPGIGSIYDVAVFENKIFLGTNRGLFHKSLQNNSARYSLAPETSGQVWDISHLDNQLFVGFNQGVLGIKNHKINLISGQAGGFSITEDPLKSGRLIQSTYSNLVVFEKENTDYRQTGIIKGFYDLIRYIEFDHRGNLWASHMHRGVYKLQLNSLRDSVVNIQYYGENSAFEKDYSIHVFKVENRIVFTTEEELFTYNDLNDSIVPYHLLNEKIGDFATAHRIVPAPNHHYWFITKEKIGLFLIRENEAELIKSIPKQVFAPHEMIDGFENIIPLAATKAIICFENCIAWFDFYQTDSLTEIENYAPQLREITLSDNQGTQITKTISKNLELKYRFNNIRVRYAFPHFTHRPIQFLTFLKGIDQSWSEENDAPVFSFDRLPAGEYELLVKAVDLWGNESMEHSMNINVLPPWYLSNYARAGYIAAFVLLVLGLQVWGIRRTRKKERQRLEKREQELIKLRNEKLRNEVEHKSKELANSTMAIVKKNEFLLKLKQSVANQKEQLGTRFPDKYYFHLVKKIDDNISSHEDWHLFETNFERAHEQFLHKIKEKFPELTSKDLRLCAFLRMNLTSKEIAPLLGISVRGVENHRYRLRKKMELEHDDSLIDMILKL
jgi:ligand-binding sensor domain-containing protein/DNA-binding CsgD family transcriptional regulator